MMRRKIVAALVIVGAVVIGCVHSGQAVGRVSGIVTYAGKPVPTGTVMFVPVESGPPAYGNIGPDGHYELSTYSPGDGAVVGTHKVMITALEQLPPELQNNPNRLPKMLVPLKYGDSKSSGLTFEVKAGDNTIDISLK
jgi:hypothetical protein